MGMYIALLLLLLVTTAMLLFVSDENIRHINEKLYFLSKYLTPPPIC
jgi:hypothetical protein